MELCLGNATRKRMLITRRDGRRMDAIRIGIQFVPGEEREPIARAQRPATAWTRIAQYTLSRLHRVLRPNPVYPEFSSYQF
jgi:hypothetical protein